MPPQFVNPLSLIGQSTNQPDVAGANKALRDLQTRSALTRMQQTGAAERSTATDLSRLTGTLAPHGLSPESIRQPGLLSTILGQIGAERGGKSAASLVKAGIRDIGKGGYKPGEFYKRDVTAGHMLPGVAMETAKLKSTREKGKRVKGVERTPSGGFEQYERYEKAQQTGKSRSPEAVKELHKIVTDKFGKNARIVGETDTHLLIRIGDAEPFEVKKRIAKGK